VTLDVVDELRKNGLIKSSGKKEKFFVEYLAKNWKEEKVAELVVVNNKVTRKSERKAENSEMERRITYPVSNMVYITHDAQEKLPQSKTVKVEDIAEDDEVKEHVAKMAMTNDNGDGKGILSETKIVVVFATNASMFRVKLQTGQKEGNAEYKEFIDIMKEDVDIYGVLKSESDKAGTFLEHFQDEYELRFQKTTFEFQFY
jgi:hypothetical protein